MGTPSTGSRLRGRSARVRRGRRHGAARERPFPRTRNGLGRVIQPRGAADGFRRLRERLSRVRTVQVPFVIRACQGFRIRSRPSLKLLAENGLAARGDGREALARFRCRTRLDRPRTHHPVTRPSRRANPTWRCRRRGRLVTLCDESAKLLAGCFSI